MEEFELIVVSNCNRFVFSLLTYPRLEVGRQTLLLQEECFLLATLPDFLELYILFLTKVIFAKIESDLSAKMCLTNYFRSGLYVVDFFNCDPKFALDCEKHAIDCFVDQKKII